MKKIIYLFVCLAVLMASCKDTEETPTTNSTSDGSTNETCRVKQYSGILDFVYNAAGQLIELKPTIEDIDFSAKYEYDNSGRLIRLEQVADGDPDNYDITYNSDGTISKVHNSFDYGTPSSRTYTYGYQGGVLNYAIRKHSDGQSDSILYTIANGNIVREEIVKVGEPGYWQVWDYTYDNQKRPTEMYLDEVSAHQNKNNWLSYTFRQGTTKPNGEREETADPDVVSFSIDYNENGHPTTIADNDGNFETYTYDCE